MLSNHLRFGLPLLFSPGTSTTITITLLPTYSSSLLNTYHFNILSCTFLEISPTFVVPVILSFLILSSLVTHFIHLNILISAASNFFSCAFSNAHLGTVRHCWSYNCLVYFPLDSQTYSSVAQNPRYPLLVFPSWLYSMRHIRIQVSILCQCRS